MAHKAERERIARAYASLLRASADHRLGALPLPGRIFAMILYERNASVPLHELASISGASPSAASRSCFAMEAAGMVEVLIDPDDRRLKVLKPTPALRAAVDAALAAFQRSLEETGTFLAVNPKKK